MVIVKSRALFIGILIVSILLIAILAVRGIAIYDRKTLPRRLTSSVKGVVAHKELFTESKLISYSETGPINLNGDGSMTGTYKLSPDETELLLSSSLAVCPRDATCDEGRTSYTINRSTQDVINKLDVDPYKNVVIFEVIWY